MNKEITTRSAQDLVSHLKSLKMERPLSDSTYGSLVRARMTLLQIANSLYQLLTFLQLSGTNYCVDISRKLTKHFSERAKYALRADFKRVDSLFERIDFSKLLLEAGGELTLNPKEDKRFITKAMDKVSIEIDGLVYEFEALAVFQLVYRLEITLGIAPKDRFSFTQIPQGNVVSEGKVNFGQKKEFKNRISLLAPDEIKIDFDKLSISDKMETITPDVTGIKAETSIKLPIHKRELKNVSGECSYEVIEDKEHNATYLLITNERGNTTCFKHFIPWLTSVPHISLPFDVTRLKNGNKMSSPCDNNDNKGAFPIKSYDEISVKLSDPYLGIKRKVEHCTYTTIFNRTKRLVLCRPWLELTQSSDCIDYVIARIEQIGNVLATQLGWDDEWRTPEACDLLSDEFTYKFPVLNNHIECSVYEADSHIASSVIDANDIFIIRHHGYDYSIPAYAAFDIYKSFLTAKETLLSDTLKPTKHKDSHKLRKQFITPACKGGVCPTLMASTGGNADWYNVLSTGKYPRPGVIEIWDTCDETATGFLSARYLKAISSRGLTGNENMPEFFKILKQMFDDRLIYNDILGEVVKAIKRMKDSQYIRLRKLTPKEYFRFMGVSERDIKKLMNSGIPEPKLYKLAGNSIVVNPLMKVLLNLVAPQYNTSNPFNSSINPQPKLAV